MIGDEICDDIGGCALLLGPNQFTASAAGVATVSGAGIARWLVTGLAQGIATVSGAGIAGKATTGTAVGTSSVSGVGAFTQPGLVITTTAILQKPVDYALAGEQGVTREKHTGPTRHGTLSGRALNWAFGE